MIRGALLPFSPGLEAALYTVPGFLAFQFVVAALCALSSLLAPGVGEFQSFASLFLPTMSFGPLQVRL